jgi:hypothetical protein
VLFFGRQDHLHGLRVGIPGNFRASVTVEPIGDGVACLAIVYMKSRELAVPIHTPYLDQHLAQIEHAAGDGARRSGPDRPLRSTVWQSEI